MGEAGHVLTFQVLLVAVALVEKTGFVEGEKAFQCLAVQQAKIVAKAKEYMEQAAGVEPQAGIESAS